jgi:hypothetical protein
MIFRVKVAEIYLIGAIGVENLDFAGDRLGYISCLQYLRRRCQVGRKDERADLPQKRRKNCEIYDNTN